MEIGSVKNKFKIPGFTRKKSGQATGLKAGIHLYFYGDYDHSVQKNPQDILSLYEYGQSYSVEELCLKAARKLQLDNISILLFSLASRDLQIWYAPNDTIQCDDTKVIEFIFRLRFKPAENNLHILRENHRTAFEYFYLQMRDDFVQDRIDEEFQRRKADQKILLGIAAIDMVRHARQYDREIKDVKNYKLSKFITGKQMQEFSSIVDKKRLQLNIENIIPQIWQTYAGKGVHEIYMYYMFSILEAAPQYLVESFPIRGLEKCVVVDPFHQRHPGIYFSNEDATVKNEGVCSIDELDTVVYNENQDGGVTSVMINRKNGQPSHIMFDSADKAKSFVTLICGYFRLYSNWNMELCVNIRSEILNLHKENKCHGPISLKYAEMILGEINEKDRNFNFLLKQKSDLDKYAIIHMKDTDSDVHIINQLQSGGYQLQSDFDHSFASLRELLAHYIRENGKLNLKRGVPINKLTSKNDPRLYLCRPSGSRMEDNNTTKQDTGLVFLSRRFREIVEHLGQGKFTNVYKCSTETDNEMSFVAVKEMRIRDTTPSSEFLMESIQNASFWNTPSILVVKAVHLVSPFQVALELSDYGDLSSYFGSRKSPIKVYQAFFIAENIANALVYLHERQDFGVHGNIRCRNIMVVADTGDRVKVKLADPGMVYYYNTLALDHKCNYDRLPWLAPECIKDIVERRVCQLSKESDRYAFAMFLYEMFNGGQQPFSDCRRSEEIWDRVKKERMPERPKYCPRKFFADVIEKCWDEDSEKRPEPHDCLKLIRSAQVEKNLQGEGAEYARVAGETAREDDGIALEDCDDEELMYREIIPIRISKHENNNKPKSNNISYTTPIFLHVPDDLDVGGATAKIDHSKRALPPIPRKQAELTVLRREQLGQGHYGQVYKGYYMEGDQTVNVAVKSLKTIIADQMQDNEADFQKEYNTMMKLNHENIVRLVGWCPRVSNPENTLLLVMEFVENGSLQEFRNNMHSLLTQDKLLSFIKQIAEGMRYLTEEKHIIHRDLAARNVLVNKQHKLKVSDFGLAKVLDDNRDYYTGRSEKALPAYWCSIEALLYRKFSMKSDVWSYGVTAWEVMSNRTPKDEMGNDPKKITDLLQKGKRLSKPENCPQAIYDLMQTCWSDKPQERPSFTEILSKLNQVKT